MTEIRTVAVTDRARIAGVILLVMICIACAVSKQESSDTPQQTVRKAGVTDYSSEGKLWFLGVGARASRMIGPQQMLPLNLVLVNKNAGRATISRESLVLETPDRKFLPVVSYAQFKQDYRRDRSDRLAGEDYIQRFTGRFSSPPYIWRELEFFPLRNSSVVPRDSIETRDGELVYGYVYFAIPSNGYEFPPGKYKLLFTPRPGDETFVVEIFPF